MTSPAGLSSLRYEEAAAGDREAIAALLESAFSGPDERELVSALRGADLVVAEAVARLGGRLLGHVLFSKLQFEDADAQEPGREPDRPVAAAALAPLAVSAAWRRQGIGAALVRHGLGLCARRGIGAVLVLGHPAYYSRFGFSAGLAKALQAPYGGEAFMALEILPGCLRGPMRRVIYPAPFAALP